MRHKDKKRLDRIMFEQYSRQQGELFYVVFPGSERLGLGPRRGITITRNRSTAEVDVQKYGKYGVIETVDRDGLNKVLSQW